jgi:pre-mRNA-splicing factor SPF27
MPLGLESTDFLSREFLRHGINTRLTIADIDTELQPQDRSAIIAQIRAELPSEASTTLHPSIPDAYEPKFGPLIEAELARIEQKREKPVGTGIDVERYEASALEAPERTSPHSDEHDPELLAQWRQTLQRAYGLKTYLDGRLTNLSLLETYGKNAWLIGNSQLEDILRGLERELAEMKRQAEEVEEQRRRKQGGARGEIEGLEESWKRSVRGIVEVELATENLRQEILARRRAGAVG